MNIVDESRAPGFSFLLPEGKSTVELAISYGGSTKEKSTVLIVEAWDQDDRPIQCNSDVLRYSKVFDSYFMYAPEVSGRKSQYLGILCFDKPITTLRVTPRRWPNRHFVTKDDFPLAYLSYDFEDSSSEIDRKFTTTHIVSSQFGA